ncbi:MAG: hypothetical protein P8Z00_11725 [Anaerolineales bacterium]
MLDGHTHAVAGGTACSGRHERDIAADAYIPGPRRNPAPQGILQRRLGLLLVLDGGQVGQHARSQRPSIDGHGGIGAVGAEGHLAVFLAMVKVDGAVIHQVDQTIGVNVNKVGLAPRPGPGVVVHYFEAEIGLGADPEGEVVLAGETVDAID